MVLKKLAEKKLNWSSVQEVRDRLIVVSRLLNLARSIDLARTWRRCSRVGDQFYVLTQRKGQRTPQWEAMVSLADNPSISPVHLMQAYVRLTSAFAPAGSLLLRQLQPPYDALQANTVGSITKKVLRDLGIPTQF